MTCDKRYQKSALNAYTRAEQTVNAQSVVVFNNNAPLQDVLYLMRQVEVQYR